MQLGGQARDISHSPEVCLRQSQLRGQARDISYSPEVFHKQHIISVCQVFQTFSIVVASGSHVHFHYEPLRHHFGHRDMFGSLLYATWSTLTKCLLGVSLTHCDKTWLQSSSRPETHRE